MRNIQIGTLKKTTTELVMGTDYFTPEDQSNEDLVRVFYNDANWERQRRAELLAKEQNVEKLLKLSYQKMKLGGLIFVQCKKEPEH